MKQAVLEASHITQQFWVQGTSLVVLDDVSCTFQQGSTYALVGASGSGKSTLLHILAGLEQPTEGAVLYKGTALATYSERELQDYLQNEVGLLFQQPHLMHELSILENVMLKGLIAGKSYQALEHRAHDLLAMVGLAHKITTAPAALSGGEKQRIALARALFIPPKFLLADEPTAHLDPVSQDLMLDLILSLQAEFGMGVIIASHDSAVVKRLANRLLLQDGRCSMEQL